MAKTLPSSAVGGGSVLEWELRSHMPCGQKPKCKTEAMLYVKFNKDFKHSPHQNQSLKKKLKLPSDA